LDGSVNDLKGVGVELLETYAMQRLDIESSFLVLVRSSEEGQQRLEKQFIG
jgi:hypothetical protein